MANNSGAWGTMTLKGDWTPSSIKKINEIARMVWAQFHYDLSVGPFSDEEISQTMSGNGRWTFTNNLESLGAWTSSMVEEDEGLLPSYNMLLAEMEAEWLLVHVSFYDCEPNNHVLYTQSGTLSAKDGHLAYTIASEERYDYNWTN